MSDHDDIEDDGLLPQSEHGLLLVQRSMLALYLTLWSLHWTATGDPSYGDHLLWDRAQKRVRKDLDRVAELCAGIYDADELDPRTGFDDVLLTLTIPDADEPPAIRGLDILAHVSELVVDVHNGLPDDGVLGGPDILAAQNVLAGVADHLHELAYLIQQRLGGHAKATELIDLERRSRSDD